MNYVTERAMNPHLPSVNLAVCVRAASPHEKAVDVILGFVKIHVGSPTF
jgi:hypothetical protein